MGPEKSIPAVNPSLHVMVVDDELNIRKTLSVCLETEGHMVTAVSNFKDALAEALRRSFDLAFVDLRLGTDDGLDLIPALLAATPGLKIIVITAYGTVSALVLVCVVLTLLVTLGGLAGTILRGPVVAAVVLVQ